MIAVVIMAGGAGTRFWPMSTEQRPKQFLTLFGTRSLLQLSYDRIRALVAPENILVLTSEAYRAMVAEQLPELPAINIIGEPLRRDTAAAIAWAALILRARFSDPTMVVLTSDHVIEPVASFQDALLEAVEGCQQGSLYTLGIRPTYAATGFGYLQMGELIRGGKLPHYRVESFKEKPGLEVAQSFVASGRYAWNSGMFVWRVESILKEFQLYLPRHLELLAPVVFSEDVPSKKIELLKAFEALERISIDYAILEKAADVHAVIPEVTWDDLGGWMAMGPYLRADRLENRCRGRVGCEESKNNLVFSEDDKEEILLLGVEKLVVVRVAGRTLVADRQHLDLLKEAVGRLEIDEC